ncbi:nucleolar protein 12-domain-containing protein [Biscogniauxia mediterranea]|nr:nucleolar protein 12-domain-containing protein [Biscogniauxia mediterranea]
MFARPRPKKNVLSHAPRKRKAQHGIEEIKFDDDARVDYLTGFHKRKVQRAKQAQEQAAKKARQDKIEFRRQLREDRKRQAEEHVQHVEAMLKEAQQAGYIDGGDDDDGEGDSGDEAGEWGGFQDEPATQEDMVDHEEEYIDEERYTTVTVESVSVSKDGLFSSRPDEEEGEEDLDGDGEARAKEARSTTTSTATAGRRNDQSRPPKKKKQKFRYETKLERQISQKKERASNKRRPRD